MFRREYKKAIKSGDPAPDDFTSTWPFFDQMKFLTDIMNPRDLKGNVLSPETSDVPNNPLEVAEDENDQSPDSQLSNTSIEMEPESISAGPSRMSTPLSSQNKLKQGKKREMDEEFLAIEKRKLQMIADNQSMKNDSDFQFLVSLHPYLKNVPPHRKLLIRNKLQQVFIDEEERTSTNPLNTQKEKQTSASPLNTQLLSWEIGKCHSNSTNLDNSEDSEGVRTYFQQFSGF